MHIHKLDTLYLYYGVKGQPGIIWVMGVKRSFSPKVLYITCSYCIAWPQNWYMCISLRPSTYLVGPKVNLGSFGVTSVKNHFCLKCYKIRLYKIARPCIRLVHSHQLGTICLCYGVNGQHGVIRGHRGQMLVFTSKLSLNCQCNAAQSCDLHIQRVPITCAWRNHWFSQMSVRLVN